MGNKCLDCTALTLTIIGAINWGLIGFFRFDLFVWRYELAVTSCVCTCWIMWIVYAGILPALWT